MKIVTVATDLQNSFLENFLIPSCTFFNLDLTIITTNCDWASNRIKDFLLLEYLDKLDSNEIVLYTDAYDTILNATENKLKKRFLNFNKKIVFSTEINCWPYEKLHKLYPFDPINKYKYLNGGGFIGYAGTIKSMLMKYRKVPSEKYPLIKKLNKKENINLDRSLEWSNQYYWTLIYLSEQKLIGLDKHCKIFRTFTPLLKTYVKILKSKDPNDCFLLEVRKIKKDLLSGNTEKCCNLHFNGPIPKNAVQIMYESKQLPKWLSRIFEIKKDREDPEAILQNCQKH
jgi:hypothetical protein